jgi:hypothetical protein
VVKQKKLKNGIFFLIDALRFDAINDQKKRGFLFPNIDKIVGKSSLFKCTSNSRSTQFVLPSIFTLSYPLDYGGYDNGIRNRPLTVAEFLKKKGMKTCFISNCNQVGVTGGYDRGFDTLKASVDFKTLLEQRISRTIKPKYLREKKISKKKAKSYLKKEFGFFLNTLIKNIENYDKSIWTKKLLKNNTELAKLFKLEKNILNTNISLVEKKIETISPGNYRKFLGHKKIDKISIFIDKFFSGISWRARKFISDNPRFFPFQWFGHISIKFDEIQSKFYSEVENLMKLKQPFYMYVHCMDVHDNRDISNLKYYFSKHVFFFKWLYARFFGLTNRTFNYDSSLMMVDKNLKKIVEMINNKKFENTVFLITADHGLNTAVVGQKRKPFLKERFLEMYREDLEVPLILFENGKKKYFKDEMIDSIDMVKIFLNKLGIKKFPKYFRGQLPNKSKKNFVISEHGGRGSTDIKLNTLYFAITNSEEKLVVKLEKKFIEPIAFFNLKNDPNELKNLINKNIVKNKINNLLRNLYQERGVLIKKRMLI